LRKILRIRVSVRNGPARPLRMLMLPVGGGTAEDLTTDVLGLRGWVMKVPLTIGDFLRRGAAVYAGRPAVFDEPGTQGPLGTLSYRQLASRAVGMALALDELGVDHGERVAIVSPNAARFQIAFFGVSGYGRILVPINYRLNADEISYIVD